MHNLFVWNECIDALAKMPQGLQRVAVLVPAERWEHRPSPDRYSPRELLYHLIEVEEAFYQRYRLIAEQEHPTLTVYDEDDDLSESGFPQGSVYDALTRFVELRNRSLEFLQSLPIEARERTGRHPEFGEWSIFQQVQLCVAHDLVHLSDILLRTK